MIVGNSLLTARGIPTAGEGDLKTNLAQLILDRLGAGGSYTEYYALDFDEDFVLMGHDGPGHVAIAQEQPTLRALKLYHGKRGAGLSVEFKVRYGPVTIVGCTQTADGRAEAARRPRASRSRATTFRIGNTNSRLRFGLAAGRVLRALVRARARRTTSRSASATSPTRCARSRRCSGSSTRRWAEWSASASCCASGPTGSTSTGRATARCGRRCSRRCARPAGATTRSSSRDDGLLVGYLETEDFAAALAGDGGDRRQRALAGGDGRVLRAASGERPDTGLRAPRGGLPPCLSRLRRDRPRRRRAGAS